MPIPTDVLSKVSYEHGYSMPILTEVLWNVSYIKPRALYAYTDSRAMEC